MSAFGLKADMLLTSRSTLSGTLALRDETLEDSFERDPAEAVLRTIPLKIDPALVKAVEHPHAGSGCFIPCERNSASHVSRGTAFISTGWQTASAKPAAMSFAE